MGADRMVGTRAQELLRYADTRPVYDMRMLNLHIHRPRRLGVVAYGGISGRSRLCADSHSVVCGMV